MYEGEYKTDGVKISELIEVLQKYKNKYGDNIVNINSYGYGQDFVCSVSIDNGEVIINGGL